ncbi:hypothetical protein [Duganella sp. HH101]|uniref:hypothetical protein n=1 Tax=Duganella sp. HH101 TaxID=1781066 RepID=UPI000874FCCF|nr:hypothetical protein [Duganella sp. HH101]OFA01804.1 hypothetical protein DUGA2_41370 [Duganella sp. HH101]
MRGYTSGFPRGSAGAGLLLLRLALAAQLLWHLAGAATAWWHTTLAVLLSLMLAAGLLTPVAAALCACYHLLYAGHAGSLIAAATAIALVLMGPGAYAADARLFGRRKILM